MSIVPTVIISNTAHGAANGEYNGTDLTWYSKPLKGDGYYGYTDGLHTFGFKTTGLVGLISIQASLATLPLEDDWFDTGSTFGDDTNPVTGSNFINVTGNFVWIRVAVINFTAGTINRVLYN